MKTVIITGGNTGLGFKTAGQIASNDSFHIILACRSLEKANEAVQNLTGGLHKRIEAMQLDLGSLSSIRHFVNEFKERKDLPPLGVILCNAGLQVFNSYKPHHSDG
jgi:NAD(P)-dependent dehydrogenase (short-subunit alcohol dehydrogenase family)